MRVAVTGATGFIASHLVAQLLAAGHRVHGTVRQPAQAGFLRDLPGADRLRLFPANLTDPPSFVPAVAGCDVVFHVASPLTIAPEDPQRDLVEPAVTGTTGVLDAAGQSATVRRIVLTSSVAALGEPEAGVIRDTSWNRTSSLNEGPYAYSKTLAEQAAWKYVEEKRPGFDLVAINPTVVLGPSLGPRRSESLRIISELYAGRVPAIVDISFAVVDVRDVAWLHRKAAETPGAHGRYIAWAGNIAVRDLVRVARRTHDRGKLPRIRLDHPLGSALVRLGAYTQPPGIRQFLHKNLGRVPAYDDARTHADLGVEYRSVDVTVADTIRDLVDRGHLPR